MAESEINIFRSLDFIRDNAGRHAANKANRVYLEEFRKTKKALLMKQAEISGVTTMAAQERDAYAHQEYQELLLGIKEATEAEETTRWLMVAAQAKIETWRSLESSRRVEAKTL